MPPRLALETLQSVTRVESTVPPCLLLPFLKQPQRNASILASLSDTKGAYSHRIRRGRGPSSGKGKTSGRGHKGQKQHGKVPAGFTGGQTPLHITQGDRGFTNIHAEEMSPINLDRIQDWINRGRLNPRNPITLRELVKSNAIHGIKDGVKLLSRGSSLLSTPINVIVSRASASAIAAVEALGGTVVTRYYTKPAIRRILKGETDPYLSLRWDEDALPPAFSTSTAPASSSPSSPALATTTTSDSASSSPPPPPLSLSSSSSSTYTTTTTTNAPKTCPSVDPLSRLRGRGFQYRLPDPAHRKDLEYYRDPAKRGYLSHTRAEGEGPSLFFRDPKTTRKKRTVGRGKAQGKGKGKTRKGQTAVDTTTETRLW